MAVFTSHLFENTPDGKQLISPKILAQNGPIINVTISIPHALAELWFFRSLAENNLDPCSVKNSPEEHARRYAPLVDSPVRCAKVLA